MDAYDELVYTFCRICRFSYSRIDDADTVYCSAPPDYCPYEEDMKKELRGGNTDVLDIRNTGSI